MATLSVTPSVDKWAYQTNAFCILFNAYDDNGERCTNNQLSIQYSITYDGSMPSLTEMQRIYSDASGLISLTINKPCVISIYGIYMHDINNPSKGKITQELAINYKIDFQPIIQSITASYTGPDIAIFDSFNHKDASIKALMSDGTTKTISTDNYTINGYQITKTGPNIKYATYFDTILNMTWQLEFTVNGIPKIISLEGYYQGELKNIGDRVLSDDLKVYGVFLTTSTTTETMELSSNQWYFVDIPIVTVENKGNFLIKSQNVEAIITVPYSKVTSLQLNVWYEGDKIEVGKTYNPNNIIVYLVYPNGNYKCISWKQCQIDSYLVSKEGLNWYTITYGTESRQITQKFFVEGIIYKKYVDLEFKVLYIINNTDREDLTVFFKNEIEYDGHFIFDWDMFLRIVNKLGKYGLYIITVPKLSGLSNQYDMDWEVLCIDNTTLKANIQKIYNEEDTNNG